MCLWIDDLSKQPINVNVMGKEIPQGGIWAQVRVGPSRRWVGRKEIFGEDIGPRPGRVPGLFRQKGGLVSFIYLTVLFLSCRVPF